MKFVVIVWLISGLLALLPAEAVAADLLFKNTSDNPVTVTVISPCGQNNMYLVQVAADSATKYDLPVCRPPGARQTRGLRLAVFDRRHSAPGMLAMSIAAKANVEVPAEVIIVRNDCEECDTRYRMSWIPPRGKGQ